MCVCFSFQTEDAPNAALLRIIFYVTLERLLHFSDDTLRQWFLTISIPCLPWSNRLFQQRTSPLTLNKLWKQRYMFMLVDLLIKLSIL